MSVLTQRYIDRVVAHVPEVQREDISLELSSLTSDMYQERIRAGVDGSTAEREILEELGDPVRLAATYRNAPNYLIGPGLYPVYVRSLRWLLPLALAVTVIVNIVVYSAAEAEANIGSLIGQVVGSLLSAVVWVLGAVTLFFWVFERVAKPKDQAALARDGISTWSVDSLEPDGTRAHDVRSEAIVGLVMVAFLAVVPLVSTSFLYVEHLNDGGTFVNQALWDFWIPTYYALLALMATLQIWTVVRGRLSRTRIVLRGMHGLAVGVFLTLLISTQQILDPAIDSGITQTSGASTWVDVSYLAIIWAVVLWDLYVCVKHWRSLSARRALPQHEVR